MSTISLRVRDDLKAKAQRLARREGVSLNNWINASIAAAVAQDEALAWFDERLWGVDAEALEKRVVRFMRKSRKGSGPSREQVRRAVGKDEG